MRPPNIGRVVVLMPNGFTLLNLCLGMLAILSAANGRFGNAGLFVVLGGVADVLDGRIARATRSGTRFGEELDSLVDLVSFGVAPALIMYFLILREKETGWLWAFVFVAAAAMRLAKFNVEQAGKKKTHFYGLPSPAAGMTLASYWWFSQTNLYTETFVGALPWQNTMIIVMIVLAVLMMSNVQYPAVPTIGFRTLRGLIGLSVVLGTFIGILFFPEQFFFPALITYVAYGLAKTAIMGFFDRRLVAPRPVVARAADLEPDQEGAQDVSGLPDAAQRSPGRRRRRRRRRGGRGGEQAGGETN